MKVEITQSELDKQALFTLLQNGKLLQFGMVIIDGKLTTIDQHLKK